MQGTYRLNWLTLLPMSLLVIAFAVFAGGSGCPVDDDDDTTGDDDDVTGDDDDTVADPFVVSGNIYAVPVTYEDDGEGGWTRVELEWADVNPDGYGYGKFYAAMTANSQSVNSPFVIDVPPLVPADPKTTPTPYELTPDELPVDLTSISVMAAADSHNNDVLSSRDAMAFYPDPIAVIEGTVEDIDITIDIEHKWCDRWVPGFHGEGCGGGCSTTTAAGQAVLHGTSHGDATGPSMVAIYDEGGGGPWWVVKPGDMDGANQDDYLPFETELCMDWTAQILGAWDWNDNGLFEPTDDWGITVDGIGGEVIHEWDITTDPLTDLLIRMPEQFGLPLWNPYIEISGVVQAGAGWEFSELGNDDAIIVIASKTPTVEGDTLAEIISTGQIYGYDLIEGANALGDQIPYRVWVKPYTTVHLLAGVDVGGDGNYASDPEPSVESVHVDYAAVTRNLTIDNGP